MPYLSSNIYVIILAAAIFLLGSCNVARYLEDDEYLVKKNKVEITDKIQLSADPDLIYNLESFIIQKPNRDYFFLPREWIYFRNEEEFLKSKKRKGILKEAELPVLHEDEAMFKTAEQMEKYLRFSKGFYNAKVYPIAFLSEKRADVTYQVVTSDRYTIRSKEYFSEDERIRELIESSESSTLLKEGTKVDEAIFDEEKSRIVGYLQNKGFAAFTKSNIDFKADSSDLQMDVFITILPPSSGFIHRQYTIGDIEVYPDYRGSIKESYSNAQELKGIKYAFDDENYFIKPRTLSRAMDMQERILYKKYRIDNTYRSLAKLGTYRFINISSQISEEQDTVINYKVFLTPIEKTWAIDGSLDLFYSYLAQNSLNRLGLSANTSLSNLNAFGGGEKFSFSLETTNEINLPEFQFSSFTFKAQTSLRFPTLLDPGNIILKGFERLPQKLGKGKYDNVKNKTNTDLGLSYSYISQIFQYQTNSFNASLSYDWRPNQKFTYLYTPININSVSNSVNENFRMQFLDTNELLARSFDNFFITGFGIQEFVYRMQSPTFSTGFSWGINLVLEQSGTEIFAANTLYNAISGENTEWAFNLAGGNQFDFSKYFLSNVDLRASQKLGGKHSLAGRFKVGFALPFSLDKDNAVIPFLKQYYVGGANSLRAWQTRELGPGGWADDFYNPLNDQAFFQTGDFVLETSLEYRFPIYYVFEGGLFVDAGNVWTLSSEDSRTDSQLTWDFYNQIAVGYGFGIRINLDFLVIRFDFGYKLRYPFPHQDFNDRYWRAPELTTDYLLAPNITIGINYPF